MFEKLIDNLSKVEKVVENVAYGTGNATAIINSVGPSVGLGITGARTGLRIGKAIRSYAIGTPSFYAHVASAGFSAVSLGLQLGACAAATACPPAVMPLFASSQVCGGIGDALDNSVSVLTAIF